jgi:hypothetical protein
MRNHTFHLQLSLWLCVLIVSAQAQQRVVPTVFFSCDFPNSDPAHYAISVSSDGHGSYISDGRLAPDSEPDQPFTIEFTMPQATLTRIFDLTKKAHYFAGKIDSAHKNIASTGDKTLSYKDAQKNTSAEYNFSTIPAVQELTTLFQNLSATLEFGRRLAYDHRYQRLALDEELKRLDDSAGRGETADMSVISATLQQIADDPTVVNGARARALRLLQRAGGEGK